MQGSAGALGVAHAGHGRRISAAGPLPGAGERVVVRAELAAEGNRGALVAAPDREGAVADLPHVVERVAEAVVEARLDVGAGVLRPEEPLASDDLEALDLLPLVHEVDALDQEVSAREPLELHLPGDAALELPRAHQDVEAL